MHKQHRTFENIDEWFKQLREISACWRNRRLYRCAGRLRKTRIYEHRPLARRLEGAPMVDIHQGLFGDWCELNFKGVIPEGAAVDFQQDCDRIDAIQEARSARRFCKDLLPLLS